MFAATPKIIAPILLSAALVGCRDDRLESKLPETPQPLQPPPAFSLAEAQDRPEGSKVYLTNVTLVPMPTLTSKQSNTVRYQIVDASGQRAKGILDAPMDSFLWRLAPSAGERSYSSFGATIHRVGEENILAIFKLSN